MNDSIKDSKKFRVDINGLRAWAVVAVVLFHFDIPGFDGGFVGVDAFFVISGFLMTGIVMNGLEKNGTQYSLLNFYLSRARRILPALAVLCGVLLAAGAAILPALDYKELGKHAWLSVSFLSNIAFWREAGYFDSSSHDKWLLHTWSLAVEWQFYIVLPLILRGVWKLKKGRRPAILAITAGLFASLAACLLITPWRPSAAFFLLPTRAWEMLAGGLTLLIIQQITLPTVKSKILEALGFALLIGSIVGFDSSSPWPGWRSILPVAGTMALLIAARTDSIFTATPAAQWLGTRSYSLYLWHWPIAVALNYSNNQDSFIAIAAGLTLTLALGDLSYRLVENPTRVQSERLRPLMAGAALTASALVVIVPSLWISLLRAAESSHQPVDLIRQEALNSNPRRSECHSNARNSSPSCVYGGKTVSAVLIGDSHANSLVSAVAASTGNMENGVLEWTSSGCPIILDVHSDRPTQAQCSDFVSWVVNSLEKLPATVPAIIANRHSQYTHGPNEDEDRQNIPEVYFSQAYKSTQPAFLAEYAKNLISTTCHIARTRAVYLVRPIPEMGMDVPRVMARALSLGTPLTVSISIEEYHRRNAHIWAAQDAAHDKCGAIILDPLPFLCSNGRCYGAKEGRPVYFDDDHLSEFGNKLLTPMFAEVFRKTRFKQP